MSMARRRHGLILGLVTALALLTGAVSAMAQGSCARMVLSSDVLSKWSNPKPDANDILMPIAGGLSIAFTSVPLGDEGLYEGPIYKMGSEQSQSFAFETPLDVRVGSAIVDAKNRAVLLLGKYELSKGQYVMIMGGGDIAKGIQVMREKWQDRPRSTSILGPYLNEADPCYRVMTAAIIELLAEPITFLSYGDYTEAIDTLNSYCIARLACQSLLTGLGRNPDFPGFVRLPTEHEWEFVARGGLAFMQGALSRAALQTDVPFIAPGKTLSTYAHIDNDPARLTAIGSRERWFGFYDMLGNAEELMQNPFTAENGFGAVGAYVARGGHYRLTANDIRVSKRVELSLFLRDDGTGQFGMQYFPFTGIRLAVGLPVVGSLVRTGDRFDPDAYVPINEAGDIAGNSINEARVLGALVSTGPAQANDEVSSADLLDYYTFDLREFATVELSLSLDTPIKVTVTDDNDRVYLEKELTSSTPAGQPLALARLLPQKYIVLLEPIRPTAKENKYRLQLERVLEPDTGVERPSTADLATATEIGTTGIEQSGFVGSGDRSDFYPVTTRGSSGAISIIVTGHSAPLTISFLNERQQMVAQTIGTSADKSIELSAPFGMGERGFVQIMADANSSTLYKMTLKTSTLYDPIFAGRMSDTRNPAVAGKTYEGYLSPRAPTLYMPVVIGEPRKLRVELSGISANVDLGILNRDGTRIETESVRDGTSPEFAELNLQSGTYYVRATLADQSASSKFTIFFDLQTYSGKGTGAGGVSADTLRTQATQLPSPTSGGVFRTLTSKATAQYYAFSISEKTSMVTIDLMGFTAASDLDVFLEGKSGQVIAKSTNSGATDEAISEMLSQGQYFIRVQPSGTAVGSPYYLSVVGVGAMSEPDLAWMGTLVETNEDYKVYKEGDRCYMVTIAAEVKPELGWLQSKPAFYIGVERGSSSVWIALLSANAAGGIDIIQSGSVSSTVVSANGSRRSVPAMFEPGDKRLQPLVTTNCDVGYCVDSGALGHYRQGRQLVLAGTTAKDNQPFQIVYSLRGYTRSATRINELCSADARWVTGR